MPHLIVEYSGNLDADLDISALLKDLHDTAISIEALPIGGVRTRAARREHFEIADGHEDNAFINVTLRIARGRPLEVRKAAGDKLFAALRHHVDPIYNSRPLALSFEIQEIEPETRWKQGNIREYLARRAN